jgi:uncharacterized protein (TIGR03437 family)
MRVSGADSRSHGCSGDSTPPGEILRKSEELSMTVRPFMLLIVAASAVCRLLYGQASATTDAPIVLTVEVQNHVQYRGDTFDVSKIAKDPNATTTGVTTFITAYNIGDIRSVNGDAMRGLWSSPNLILPFRASPQPGQPIADIDSGGMSQCIWQIVTPDGRYLGTLIDNGAAPSPHHIVTGGAGIFLGTTGVHGSAQTVVTARSASTSEDPANRRNLGGGSLRITFYLYPKTRPAVISTSGGPAVTHADGRLVSSDSPAQPGEVLTLYATGLGPTTPFVDIGQPFRQGSAYRVNAPVDIKINGQSTEVLYAGGYPGAVDGYQVNFRVPPGIIAGAASLQLAVAWIPGAVVPVQIK